MSDEDDDGFTAADRDRDARMYRERLRRQISMHEGVGRATRPAPEWLRRARAEWLWEQAAGYAPPTAWSIDDIVLALVVRAYGEPITRGRARSEHGR